MADPFVAEIRIFPFNFAPRGWAMCNGQILPLSQNTALFSLLGTTYGGDGKSTFALPDLQGSVPLHPGQGQGLSSYFLGQSSGSQTATLLQTEIPTHTHVLRTSTSPANRTAPSGNSIARASGATPYIAPGGQTTTMAFEALGLAGGSQPHNNMQPFLTLNFCIALQGIFPPRS